MKVVLLVCMLVMLGGIAQAEMIILKTGRTVKASIVQRHNDYIEVDVGVGQTLTYFHDQIDRINVDYERITNALSVLVRHGWDLWPPNETESDHHSNAEVARMLSKFQKGERYVYKKNRFSSINPHVDERSTCVR